MRMRIKQYLLSTHTYSKPLQQELNGRYPYTIILLKSKLPPLVSFITRGVSFLSRCLLLLRCFSFLSRCLISLKNHWQKHLVRHILHARNLTSVTIVALQFTGKVMGPSNTRYICASIVMHWLFTQFISNKHWSLMVIILGTEFESSENTVVFNHNLWWVKERK